MPLHIALGSTGPRRASTAQWGFQRHIVLRADARPIAEELQGNIQRGSQASGACWGPDQGTDIRELDRALQESFCGGRFKQAPLIEIKASTRMPNLPETGARHEESEAAAKPTAHSNVH